MKVSFHRQRAAVVAVATIVLVGVVPGHAEGRPEGMSERAYRALVVRSQALDDFYAPRVESSPVRALAGATGAAAEVMPTAAYRALAVRSRELNRRYGLGRFTQGSTDACGITRRHW